LFVVLALLSRVSKNLGMALGFVPVDRDQLFLLPPDLRSWLPADHEVWLVIDLVESLDLSVLVESYRLGAQGRAPISPVMLMTLLVWAYSHGVVSSRAIERACRQDVAFRVICANAAPDHTTIARFRQRHEKAAEELFVQVLQLCRRAGLVRIGTVAIDGTKFGANASLSANREVARLREQVAEWMTAAAAADAAEDEQFGEGGPGGGLPEELTDRDRRMARIRELLDGLGDHDQPAKSVNLTDPDSRIMPTKQGFVQGFNAQVVCGEDLVVLAAEVSTASNDYHQLVPMLDQLADNLAGCGAEVEIGTVLADAGYFTVDNLAALDERGLDALIATTKRHKQPAEPAAVDPATTVEVAAEWAAERAQLDAHVVAERARKAAIFARVDREGLRLADHLDELGMSLARAYVQRNNWRAGGVEAITIQHRRPAKVEPRQPTPAEQARNRMDARLADPATRAHYNRRSHLVETAFGELKHNRHVNRFQRRGLNPVRAEWRLHAVALNISKVVKALTAGGELAPS
jgi:transposase